MVRMLPGVYISLYDLTTLPEGTTNLAVGCVLKAKRGPVGAELVVSPTDFLQKYTLSGAPAPSDDTAYHTILKILKQTNHMYISRAQTGALYGGLLIKREHELGNILSVSKLNKTIAVEGDITSKIKTGDIVRYNKPASTAGRYTVVSAVKNEESVVKTMITVKEEPKVDYTYTSGQKSQLILTQAPVQINTIELGAITGVDNIDAEKDGVEAEITTRKVLTLAGDLTKYFLAGDRIRLAKDGTDYYFTVLASNKDGENTRVAVNEVVDAEVTTGTLYRHSIANPEAFAFSDEDLFLVTGIDQGAYNNKLGVDIVSSTESPDSLNEANVFTISTYDMTTRTQLALPMMCARNEDANAFDGSGIYVEDVVNSTSAYIKVVNNLDVDGNLLPCNTVDIARLGGGYDGEEVTEADMISALDAFSDKTIPISILANGSQETPLFQQAMLELATTRLDCVAFLNNRKVDEQATFNSKKAQNIVDYKKGTLGSTTYLGTMYAPHVTIADAFNSRHIKVGADAIAI